MPGQFVIDVTDRTFEDEVLRRSLEVPVVVDLWAPWCGPCRALGPTLEALAEEGGGSWILAKVNVDESPGIAQAMRVQGIPAVKAFVEGRIVDEFTGAQPRPMIEQWLARFVQAAPQTPAGLTPLEEAHNALLDGDLDGASTTFHALLADEEVEEDVRVRARIGLALVAIRSGALDEGQSILDDIPDASRELAAEEYQSVWFALRSIQIEASPEELQARVQADPNDHAARRDLAIYLIADGAFDAGLELLLFTVMVNRAFDDDGARKLMIRAFDIMGHRERHTIQWQGRLGAAMY